jgi:hypothetical protein
MLLLLPKGWWQVRVHGGLRSGRLHRLPAAQPSRCRG